MFKNFKLMIGQLLFITIIAFFLDKTFELPQWINFVIPASCFIVLFLGIQITDSITKIDNTISSDGIAGARSVGIFVNAILLPWSLGWFKNIYVDVLMLLGALFCIVKGKKYFKRFFCENNWEKEYWFIYWGGVLMLGGIYSILSYYGIAPCGIVNIYGRVFIVLLFGVITKMSLPPNTWLAKFATKNYERIP